MNDRTSIHLLVLQMHYALPRVIFGAKFNRLLHTVLFDVMVLCSLAQNVSLQEWRNDVDNMPEDAPVSRRVPQSEQPPAFVLLHQHFGVCMLLSIVS